MRGRGRRGDLGGLRGAGPARRRRRSARHRRSSEAVIARGIANALTIAGSDRGGGAGIQADLKTFSALGVYGASVITALTAQNTREVRAIHDVPPEFIAQQIDAVFDDIRIDAVKIGMLSRPEVIETVAAGLERHGVTKLVLDPVMVAKSGDLLLAAEAVAALRERLLPLAMLVTPNLPEAAVLLAEDPITDDSEMAPACERLLALGPQWVLLKGGHMAGPESTDLLMGGDISRRFAAPRVATRNTHGTGCTLSSAIAAGLAQGLDVVEAVARAKDYVTAALKAADRLDVGTGHGPVHHFHGYW
ncbi:MAG: bifunctional hydroxymethylpyrimidine kinase/phosphomethylpyrimidine kinase [Proteobacteria bacterium]|nr:bifunctional hydroxymethylpyrimidine kinase/phosphomethylpyrimidine kinase [Pseudomonadota bacterium]